MNIDWKSTFRDLLKDHVKKGYLRDERVHEILGNMPLERLFSEEQLMRFVLTDSPALIYFKDPNNARTCSAPHMISMMTSMMELNENDNVLILGSKGGVIEGVIAQIVESVYIIEEVEEVASITEEAFIKIGIQNIWVMNDNPIYGLSDKAPFSKILITGAIPYIPHVILEQLAPEGILVAPLMLTHPQHQAIFKIIKRGVFDKAKQSEFDIINYGGVIFSPLIYREAPNVEPIKDITLQRILKYAKDYKKPEVLETKQFFEELQRLPIIDSPQIVFSHSDDISYNFIISPEKERDLQKDNNMYSISFDLYVYNPGGFPLDIKLDISSNTTQDRKIVEGITLKPTKQSQIPFVFSFPLIEGNYPLSITILGPRDYRLANCKFLCHISKIGESEWNCLLEKIL